MLLVETAIFYLVIGAGVGVAAYLRSDAASGDRPAFRVLAACLFWPLYFPLLLVAPKGETESAAGAPLPTGEAAPGDELSKALCQVESELDAALQTLDGWASGVLTSDPYRLEDLRSAWRSQAERIRELDRLFDRAETSVDALSPVSAGNERARRSEECRRENIQRLKMLRERLQADLIGTLAWVRELVTKIHLAKFTGAPAASAEELVAQIAAAVDGLSEVSAWPEEPTLAAR